MFFFSGILLLEGSVVMYEISQYRPNFDYLLDYGFHQEKSNYVLRKSLIDDLCVVFTLTLTGLQIDVYDSFQEKYLPFYVQEEIGSYVSDLRKKISLLIDDIIQNCFEPIDIRNQILLYVKEKYGIIPEYPWEEHSSYAVLKTEKKQKWFGLIINISRETLGLQGAEKVEAMNVKNDPNRIQSLIDHQHFFPAYHMNKKHWITVLLDSNLDIDLLKQLIDESYQLIEK